MVVLRSVQVLVVAAQRLAVEHCNPGIAGTAVAGRSPHLHTEDIPVGHHIVVAVDNHPVDRLHTDSGCILRTVGTAVVRIVGTVEIEVGKTERPV